MYKIAILLILWSNTTLYALTENEASFIESAAQGNIDRFTQLLPEINSINIQDDQGQSALHKAIQYGKEAIVELLLTNPNIEALRRDSDGDTALHKASNADCDQIAYKLLEHTPKALEIKNNNGHTPIHNAVCHGKPELLKILLAKSKKEHEISDNDGWTPLHYAARIGDPKAIILLIKAHAQTFLQDNFGNTPLHVALIEDNLRKTPLYVGDFNEFENMFIRQNCSRAVPVIAPELLEGSDRSELPPISTEAYYTVLPLLLKATGILSVKNNNNQTILDIVKQSRFKKASELVIRFLSTKNNLFQAVKQGNMYRVLKRLKYIPVNCQDEYGNTPLHYAVKDSNEILIKILLFFNADPTLKNNGAESPLTWALGHNNCAMLKTFLEIAHS